MPDRETYPGDAPDETPPAVHIPIDATSSDMTVIIRDGIVKLVVVLGLFLALMGASEASWLHRIWIIASSDAAVPAIAALASFIAWGWDTVRRIRSNRDKQVLTLLPTTPDAVGRGPEKPSAAVQAALERATAVIDQNTVSGAPTAP